VKYEWLKNEKEIYLPKDKPELITVPKQKFFMIKGKGNPNSSDFSERVGVLYSLAYGVRMMPKNGFMPQGYFEYTVYPLEGLWDLTDEGKKEDKLNKNELLYTIMIRQPEFVTKEVAEKAFDIVRKKKPHPFIEEVIFDELEDGLSVHIMHTGAYDDEPESFAKMKQFINDNNLQIASLVHREIYVTAKKDDCSAEDMKKLKTVLRYRVKK
jgi:hypothetical protein